MNCFSKRQVYNKSAVAFDVYRNNKLLPKIEVDICVRLTTFKMFINTQNSYRTADGKLQGYSQSQNWVCLQLLVDVL